MRADCLSACRLRDRSPQFRGEAWTRNFATVSRAARFQAPITYTYPGSTTRLSSVAGSSADGVTSRHTTGELDKTLAFCGRDGVITRSLVKKLADPLGDSCGGPIQSELCSPDLSQKVNSLSQIVKRQALRPDRMQRE